MNAVPNPARPSDRFKLTRSSDTSMLNGMWPGREVLHQISTLRPELVSEDARVTEKILDPDGAWREGQDLVSKIKAELKTVFCKSLLEWGTELRNRQEQGHTLFPCDDPKARCLGFMDDTENILFNLGLIRVHEAQPEAWAAVGIVRNADVSGGQGINTAKNRQLLISGTSDGWEFSYGAAEFSKKEEAQFKARVTQLCKLIEKEQAAESTLEDLSATIPRPQP